MIQALEDAGVSSNDISRWEVNEAFAVVALANIKVVLIAYYCWWAFTVTRKLLPDENA